MTPTSVPAIRLGSAKNEGSASAPSSSARSRSTTCWSLPTPLILAGRMSAVRDALEPLDRGADPEGERLGERLGAADERRQRHSAGEVDRVVLAEVDERQGEREGVGPADRSRERRRLGEQDRRQEGGREVKRRHRRPWVAAERLI